MNTLVKTELIPAISDRYGRHQVHDVRSWAFPVRDSGILPLTPVWWTSRLPVLDQGALGSCTANALLGMLASGPWADRLADRGVDVAAWTEDTAQDVYHAETLIDDRAIPGHWPPDDTGSAGLYSMKVAKARGWISGYHHAFSLRACLGALRYGPVSIGIPWLECMEDVDEHGVIRYEARSPVAGGHQVCLDGMDLGHNLVRVRNSWGPEWGTEGRAMLSVPALGALLAQGGDVSVPVFA